MSVRYPKTLRWILTQLMMATTVSALLLTCVAYRLSVLDGAGGPRA